jgi:ABC-type lipopolysaccharide export system ATPase subunit
MRLVMNVSDRIHVLAHGRTLAEGTAAEVRGNPAVVEGYLGVGAFSGGVGTGSPQKMRQSNDS